ncbi:hypothetical protein D3C87_749720 [compost metagenome]
MGKRVINGTGAGDPSFSVDQERANALISENPGWESEAAFRHHESSLAEEPELSPNQSIPGPMERREEPAMHFEQVGFREPTDHASS